MGFSQQDLAEQQGRLVDLDKIRFGNRIQPRERMNVSFMGVQPDMPEKSERPPKHPKPPPEPGLERYQLRLW